MKAVVCKEFGPPSKLTVEDVESPKIKDKEVLITVKTCGVNFPDTLIIQGLYQFKPELPFIPGSDVAGVVKEVGAGVKHLEVGDEVFGFVMQGGYAEEVAVPANVCFKKPNKMDFSVAASFMIAYGTSYHALKDRAKLQSGETLVVLGASGGVGLAAVELGKLMGAKVIAVASTDEKLQLCKQYGAYELINYTQEDLKTRIKELTDGDGADVIYDPVGGAYSEQALRTMAWEGRYLVVGFAAGDIPKIPLNLTLLKGCSIVGVFWGNFAMKTPQKNMENTKQLMQWLGEGKVTPHIHKVYPLAEASEALEEMMDRKVRGKVVIQCT
ncbi:NADPH:quinone oxidoreductase family protein [Mangrovivirga sp. M17]|uniref:NADPH:quinone oxidoreductase family protein n=1 Tax=Mangrovivirga halotolerans TaxID=2993936 RepID=A0ABT3RV64_9BACT|nr:NADPH:quinone oxidoreductase family protein [Mangrovivirga halotolerans]MCX2745416.1 NADPH:quinone oxidoreductase family protein [Mangrovivirga halotolerans]